MITIETAMLVTLGFLIAALLAFGLAPLYRRRAERLATEALKRTMPLTTAEIRADKDRLRAEYALTIHRLELRLEEATHATAKQMVEINRRDAGISALEGEVGKLRTSLEEHENARRVLEQTITERLPKVEFRLAEAKKLLFQRDREISALTESANRQGKALEEATQINTQQRDDVHRLTATLAARAARNREQLSDPRFDGEVALRSEIEALRTKARDQAAMIGRLQQVLVQAGSRTDLTSSGLGAAPSNGHPPPLNGAMPSETELERLRSDLAHAEMALRSARGMAEAGQANQAAFEAEIRNLKAANQDQAAELAKVKAALNAYQSEDADPRAVKESKIAMKARLSALEAQAEERSLTVQRLRAEIAATNEKLARQAAHFLDEMRRLGAGTLPASAPQRREAYDRKPEGRSLVDRIRAPRPPRELTRPDAAGRAADARRGDEDPARVNGFLRALDGASASETAAAPASADAHGEPSAATTPAAGHEAPPRGRRPGLIERITRIDKPAVTGSN